MTTVSKSIQTFGFLAASLEIPGKKSTDQDYSSSSFFHLLTTLLFHCFVDSQPTALPLFFPVFYYCLLEPPACLFPQMSRVSP